MTAGAVEVAVGAVALRDGEILLVRRGQAPGVGEWSVPGGRVHFGESLVDAVVREVREETGLDVQVERFLGWVERLGDRPAPYHFVILDFLVAVRDGDRVPVPGDDAIDARWVRFGDLGRVALVEGLREFLEDVGVVPPV